MTLLKKNKDVVESRANLENIVSELDKIHNLITSGVSLSMNEMEELVRQMNRMAMAMFESSCGLRNKYSFYFIFYVILMMLVWSALSAGILFSFLSFGQIGLLLTAITVLINNFLTTASKKQSMDRYINDTYELASEISRRIDNYTEILFKRKTQKLILDNPKHQSREANELEIANDYIGKYFDHTIVLRYIPDNIKNVMIGILQRDLDSSSTNLEELLDLALIKTYCQGYERKRASY